jgi:hypothetical protein
MKDDSRIAVNRKKLGRNGPWSLSRKYLEFLPIIEEYCEPG